MSNEVNRNYSIMVSLDRRRASKDGLYPVRLRVNSSEDDGRKQKLFSLPFWYTEDEFDKVWLNPPSSRSKNKTFAEDRIILQRLELEAKNIAASLEHFTIEEFEKIFTGGGQKGQRTINFWYEKKIRECKETNRFGTVVNYDSSLKSLLKFSGTNVIYFPTITSKWLWQYQNWMTETENKSLTTVGIYLRPLRAIFNDVKAAKIIKESLYPFGKGLYQIPAPGARKHALSKEELKAFYESIPQTPQQEKAKDFWFFSFYCNGANPKDIAFLKWKNVSKDKLWFRREKTKNTNVSAREIEVYLNAKAKEILLKYATKDKSDDSFVFPILTPGSTAEELERQKSNFTRFVSQHLKKLFKANDMDCKISYGNSRHSFANYVLNNNISVEMISEALGHRDKKTTQIYLSGFSGDKKRDLSNSLNFES